MLTRKTLVSIQNFTSDGLTIQLPNLDTKKVTQILTVNHDHFQVLDLGEGTKLTLTRLSNPPSTQKVASN